MMSEVADIWACCSLDRVGGNAYDESEAVRRVRIFTDTSVGTWWPSLFISLRGIWIALMLAVVSGCVSTPIPEPKPTEVTLQQKSYAFYVAEAREAWYVMGNPDRSAEWGAALARYNHALDMIFRSVRYENFHSKQVSGKPIDLADTSYPFTFARDFGENLKLREVYADMVPCTDINPDDLEERNTVRGLGVPLAGVVQPEDAKKIRNLRVVKDWGNVHTITAVLSFPKDPKSRQKPVLHFFLRLNRENVPVGRMEYRLAGDFSVPISLYWRLTHANDMRLLGLFRPQKLQSVTGLSFTEPYNPNKIPVVLVHGLMSSPGTFSNLTNWLLKNPEIRKNYQFWYFSYPTGVTWLVSADAFRRALHEARQELDPRHRDRKWDEMVVIGHSMGGLITRYSLSEQPWNILREEIVPAYRSSLTSKYVDKPFPNPALESFRSRFFFKPLKEPKRVIFLATPHRGAPFADSWLSQIGSWIIRLPQNILMQTLKAVTLQDDFVFLHPEKALEEMKSIRQLSPHGYAIKGLSELKIKPMPVHSIIGDRGRGNTPRSSDGIVPYWSSHLYGVQSEKIVPSGHSVQDVPETAEEVQRILLEHLRQLKLLR